MGREGESMDTTRKLAEFFQRSDDTQIPHRVGVRPKPYSIVQTSTIGHWQLIGKWKPNSGFISLTFNGVQLDTYRLQGADQQEFSSSYETLKSIVKELENERKH
jgi:hypothetical protein